MSEITVNIKCSNADKASITIERSATIEVMKVKIEECLSVAAAQQRLIYKGRVLKDDLTVEHYDIQDGHTVHMVKGAAPAAAGAPSSQSTVAPPGQATSPSPFAQPNLFGQNPAANNPFAGGLGAGLGQQPPDINRMQEQLMRNPEMMQQIMSSPMMDNLMNNPDLLRGMMTSNPQMQAMLDRNPQMRHVLNDPAVRANRLTC